MQELGCATMQKYLERLDTQPEIKKQCRQLLTVSISRFFRDRNLWTILEKQLFPYLLTAKPETIRLWSAGCAGGEEVYSFKIVWNRLQSTHVALPHLEILATDLNPIHFKRARTGVYTRGSLRDVTPEARRQYFERIPGKSLFKIKSVLQTGITWQLHDLLTNPPRTAFHIIALRNNLLTYYQDPLQQEAFTKIVHALAQPGFLIVGAHEKPPFQPNGLIAYAPYVYSFDKLIC